MSASQSSSRDVGVRVDTTASQQLKFKLYPDTSAMLPIDRITEVVKLQLAQITPIPQLPSWVMGVYNWRGDILWMLDLGQLLGLDSWYLHQHDRASHPAIILSPNRQVKDESKIHLGLVVAGVEDLEHCEPTAIQAVGAGVNARLSSFLRGYWLKASGEMILALDGQAIAAAMPKPGS